MRHPAPIAARIANMQNAFVRYWLKYETGIGLGRSMRVITWIHVSLWMWLWSIWPNQRSISGKTLRMISNWFFIESKILIFCLRIQPAINDPNNLSVCIHRKPMQLESKKTGSPNWSILEDISIIIVNNEDLKRIFIQLSNLTFLKKWYLRENMPKQIGNFSVYVVFFF